MAWPDKMGIGVACLIIAVALYGLFVLLNGLPPGVPFEVQDWTRFGVGLVKTQLFVALPIWRSDGSSPRHPGWRCCAARNVSSGSCRA
jgi:hypothetical protein